MYDKEFWNERYANEEYVYGKDPNEFLHSRLPNLKKEGSFSLAKEKVGMLYLQQGLDGMCLHLISQSQVGKKHCN